FDVKYVWELSRLQHFPRLALAYRLTGEKKYARALIEQTEDWIRNNPVGFGANWVCTMDVSIRAANLAYAFAILGEFHFESDFAVELVGNLIAHGRFIGNHLEWSDEITGNHYLANIAGLAILGCLLAQSVPEASDWVEFAQQELTEEIKKQVYPDGWDFEASTGYHRLALECFLIPAIFLDRIGKRMAKEYIAKLIHMGAFARDIAMPDGSFPLIGDNDSGLFMSLQPSPLNDLNYLIELTAAYTGDSSLKPVIHLEGLVPETLWLTVEAGWVRWCELRPSERPRTSEYQDGGLHIVKSADLRDMCTFRLGPVGQKGAGGHAHNDQLSITIWFNSKPVVVDPGTGCYTANFEKRNSYRLSAIHSVISVDGEEQNRFSDDQLFRIREDVNFIFQGLDSYSDHSQLVGSIKGYGRWAKDDIGFNRIIRHDAKRRQIEILDEVEIAEKIRDEIRGKLTWNFPLAPGLTVESRGTGYLKLLDRDGEIIAEVLFNPGWTVNLDETRFAPSYGVEEKNITLRFKPIGEIFESHFIFRAAPVMSQASIQE
ncbi:MAG: alginate lyase family protein, partial [bacterium]|nr:alginate lyase family protein [bacterium]